MAKAKSDTNVPERSRLKMSPGPFFDAMERVWVMSFFDTLVTEKWLAVTICTMPQRVWLGALPATRALRSCLKFEENLEISCSVW